MSLQAKTVPCSLNDCFVKRKALFLNQEDSSQRTINLTTLITVTIGTYRVLIHNMSLIINMIKDSSQRNSPSVMVISLR